MFIRSDLLEFALCHLAEERAGRQLFVSAYRAFAKVARREPFVCRPVAVQVGTEA
jgi:hypothetical protein